jgi:hypothetical protein
MAHQLNWLTLQPRVEWRGERRHKGDQDYGGRFRADWANTEDLLYKEVYALTKRSKRGRHVNAIIALDVRDRDMNLNGTLSARAAPNHSGVQLYIESKHGALEYQCDKFTNWKDNVRAIALTLQRLRMAELYGCVSRGQQYVGFAALPAPKGPFQTVDAAAEWLCKQVGGAFTPKDVLEVADTYKAVHRSVARDCHPDVTEGQEDKWKKLQDAKTLVDGHYAATQQ